MGITAGKSEGHRERERKKGPSQMQGEKENKTGACIVHALKDGQEMREEGKSKCVY